MKIPRCEVNIFIGIRPQYDLMGAHGECPVHGETGFRTWIEAALALMIRKDIPLTAADVVVISEDLYLEGLEEPFFRKSMLLLRKTAEDLHLQLHYDIFTDEDEARLITPWQHVFTGGLVCPHCFRDYKKRHGLQVDW